jgi:hypothetical protein
MWIVLPLLAIALYEGGFFDGVFKELAKQAAK